MRPRTRGWNALGAHLLGFSGCGIGAHECIPAWQSRAVVAFDRFFLTVASFPLHRQVPCVRLPSVAGEASPDLRQRASQHFIEGPMWSCDG
jgi:hypothetical protein